MSHRYNIRLRSRRFRVYLTYNRDDAAHLTYRFSYLPVAYASVRAFRPSRQAYMRAPET